MFHWKEKSIRSWFNLHEFLVNNCIQNIINSKMTVFEKWFAFIVPVKTSNKISKFQTSIWLLSEVHDGATKTSTISLSLTDAMSSFSKN